MPSNIGYHVLRRRIVEILATSDAVKAHSLALSGNDRAIDDAAEKVGVSPAAMREAVALAREGFSSVPGTLSKIVNLKTTVPIDMYMVIDEKCLHHKMRRPHSLVQALMHFAMQSEREPTERKDWKLPLPGREPYRAKFLAAASKRREKGYHKKGDMVQIDFKVTDGLSSAIGMRATAKGTFLSRYVRLWLADMCDGLLDEWGIHPVDEGEMFDVPESYAIPARFARDVAPGT
ncbi:MAG: hypothetical protein LUO93_07365 [Methanomicrobiales archaeon]|nr:hypothetical protein [Methanomicrobiales archaeon]